jgi:hypothetical protein
MAILELCELSISVVKMEYQLDHDGINHGVSDDAEKLNRWSMAILELCELSISVVKMECELDHDGINHRVFRGRREVEQVVKGHP